MGEKKVRFSVIIPTHNRQGPLIRCLEGLSAQIKDSDAWEVIVVDDGSSFPAKCEGFPGINISYYYQEQRGPAAARNFGSRAAGGEILVFLDDDALPLDGWAEGLSAAWLDHPEAAGIGALAVSLPGDTFYSRISALLLNFYTRPKIFGSSAPMLCTFNASYRRDIFCASGGFDEGFRQACGEDRDLSIRIRGQGGLLMVDKRIVVHHDQGCTLKSFLRKNFLYGKGAFKFYKKYRGFKSDPLSWYAELFRSVIGDCAGMAEKVCAFLLVVISSSAVLTGFSWEYLWNILKK